LFSCLALATATGCATYSERLASAHAAADQLRWQEAEDRLNDLLSVDSSDALPEVWNSEHSLGVLERAIVLQAQGDWRRSARDLSAAETELEIIDLKLDTVGKIGTYVYSDSAEEYRAPPVEQTALNALNMLNYLAMGDLQGAAVEARRYEVMRSYLETLGENHPDGRFGAYLAGFIFEHLGEAERAKRYYDEVVASGAMPSLEAPLARRGVRPKQGEVLVVVAGGRSPIKVPERIPIGAAVGIAGTWITGDARVLQHSVFKFVNYPELAYPPSVVRGARVSLDGRKAAVDLLSDLSADVTAEYAKIKPRIVAAALSRMIARAVVSEAAMAAGREAGGSGEVFGIIAGLAGEAALVALDKPDTRSWTFMPGRLWVSRIPVEPGPHEVVVTLEGSREPERRIPIDVKPGGYAAVIITEPR
jgi:hypothetical protein